MTSNPKILMQGVFFLNALGFGLWFPRIPDLKAALALDVWTLSLCLVCMSLSSMIGFLTLSTLVQRFGLRRACIWGNAVMILLLIPPSLVPGPISLGIAFLVLGQSIAVIETAINAKVNDIEQDSGIRIMSQCHAFWSYGAMVGALVGGALSQADISFPMQQLILCPLLAIIAVLIGNRLPRDAGTEVSSITIRLPSRGLLLLCILPIGALMVEGSFLDWSALYARDELLASPFLAALPIAAFNISMGTMRLYGDDLAARFGEVPVIRVSALIITIGVLGFGLAPNTVVAIPFAALAGLGAAPLYPLTMTLAANQSGRSTTQNVAAVSFFGFGAFLIGPPLIGFIGSQASLSVAFLCLTPLALYPVLIAGRAAPQRALP